MIENLQHTVRRMDNARYTGGKREASAIDCLVIHATAGDRVDAAVGWMNRLLHDGEGMASYHYLIPKDRAEGIYRMCDPLVIAYHAGASAVPTENPPQPIKRRWNGRRPSLNKQSIGIAFANDNGSDGDQADDDLTPWQRQASLWLAAAMCRRFKISPGRIFTHREVSPGRKTDPLPRIFDPELFAVLVDGILMQPG